MEQKKGKNESIDFLKGIACILVVLIHSRFPGFFGEAIVAVSRSAVAFFFVVAGYFTYNADREIVRKKCVKKLKDIFKLTIIAFAVYFLWGIFVRFVGTGMSSVVSWLKSLLCVDSVIRLFVLNEDIFAGHMWFLIAMVYAYVIIILINNINAYKIFTVIALLLLAVNLVMMNIFPIFGIEIEMTVCRNAWFYGFPLMMLANRLHCMIENDKIPNLSNRFAFFLTIAMIVIILIERVVFGYSQLYLGNIILLFVLFVYVVQKPEAFTFEPIVKLGEELSLYVYIIHWAVLNVISTIVERLAVSENVVVLWLTPVVVVIASIAAAKLITEAKAYLCKCR